MLVDIMSDEEQEERIFIENGLWFQNQLEQHLEKPLEQIEMIDIDACPPLHRPPFLDALQQRLLAVGRSDDEVQLTRKLGLLISLGFSTWFTEEE